MTDERPVIKLSEYIDQSAQWADTIAVTLERNLAWWVEHYDPSLDGDEPELPLSKTQAEKLIDGLKMIAALLRDLQGRGPESRGE